MKIDLNTVRSLNFSSDRTISVKGEAMPLGPLDQPLLRLRAIKGEEELSKVFEYTLELVTAAEPFVFEDVAANIDLKKMIGKPLTVTVQCEGFGEYVPGMPGLSGMGNIGACEREITGVVFEAKYLGQENRQARYQVTLKPWIALANEHTDYRTFQHLSVVDIVRQVLQPYGRSFKWRTGEVYPVLEYQVQYGESDLAFIQRLMAEHGLYWFIEHSDGYHRVVIVDNIGAHKPVESEAYQTLSYYPPGNKIDEEHISAFDVVQTLQPGAWTYDDYDFKQPGADLTAARQMPQKTIWNALERYEWPGDYSDPKAGERLALIRMQELRSRGERATGGGHVRNVVCGTVFSLENYPQDAANRSYLVVKAHIDAKEIIDVTGSGKTEFTTTFEVQPDTVMFRAPRVHEKPRTTGPQTAVVTGYGDSEIWTDQYGRVKVKFQWDRSPEKDHTSSCWIRVAYPGAGKRHGSIGVPRVGTEVIVDFENGDPDRPIIIGQVYNAMAMPPWPLPQSATQSGVLTRSTPGGTYETANAIRFEDAKGREQLWIQAERNMDTVVEHDETHTVGHDRTKTIGHDESDHIGKNWTLRTGGYKFETIDLAAVQNVGLGQMLNVGLAYNVNVGGLYLRNVAMQMSSTVGNNRHDRVVQDWSADVGHTYTVTVRGKAVGDAVSADRANPIEPTPDFAPQLPAPVSSAESNQLRITDSGNASLSGAKQTRLIGPGGKVTIDESGITLEGKSIRLKSSIISMSGGNAGGLAPVTETDCAECAKKTTSAHPVDVATGQKVLVQEDFTLPGRMAIRWSRSYRSADQRVGSLGAAWKLPYATEVRASATGLVYFDADGRQLQFPALEIGQSHFHPIEKLTLSRGENSLLGATYVLRFGNGVEEHYANNLRGDDTRWHLQRLTNRDGQELNLAYTTEGWLREVRNNAHTVRCTLDDAGRITAVTLVDARGGPSMCLASYVYDADGDLSEATDRAGRTWRYTYQQHLLTSYRTPSGATYASEWDGDASNARVKRTYAWTRAQDGKPVITRDTRFAYLPEASTTRVTDALGHTTEYHYNGLWAVDRVMHPDGSVRQAHFDETGSISGYTDELGRTTHTVNDAQGNPTSIIDAAGNVTRVSYNDANSPVQITDPAGQVWQRGYDDAGHLISETDPLGNTTTYAYENGLPVSRTDALGNVTKMQWNGAGQMLARTDCSGHTTRFDYDAFGNLTQSTDALGNVTRHAASATGGYSGHQAPGQGWSRIDYDDAGRVVKQTDPLARVTRTEWDAYDQRTSIIDAAEGTQGFEYDTLGRVTSLTNAKGETTRFTYDTRDRLIEQIGFDGRRQTLRYNAAGEMIERIDHGQDGQIATQLAYDALGRPVERRTSDGTQASYRYDARGLLTQAQAASPGDAANQVTFEYDAAGRRTAEVQAHHGRVWRFAHELDALGNRVHTHVPGTGTLTWQRYGSGHVHGVLLDEITLASFERDALHRETSRLQGLAAHHFSYTPAGQLMEHQWQNVDARGQVQERARLWRKWNHDKAGQITAMNDALRGEKHYRYDPLARLTSVNEARPGGESFLYDPAGNLLSVNNPQWQGRAQGDRLHAFVTPEAGAARAFTYQYDGHGNRIARGIETQFGTRYRYDGSHQLTSIEQDSGEQARYEYDALGRRIAKHHAPAGKAVRTTLFAWDGDWMAQEVNVARGPRADDAITYVPHPNHAGPLTKLAGGQVYHYVTDHLGTPQEMYDGNRKTVWAAEFSAYGQTVRSIANEVENPIRFPGQYLDAESGLHYNRFRYYDPQAGRYINQDPIGLLGGANSYAYAENGPTNAIDAVGLAAIAIGAEMGATAGSVVPGLGTVVGGVVGAIAGIGVTIWMANAVSSSTSQAGSQARQTEYERAKRFCDTPPPPGGNDCSTLSKQIDHAKECIDLYGAWDKKWLPGRHDEKIATWQNRLSNLKTEHQKKCTPKCPQKNES